MGGVTSAEERGRLIVVALIVVCSVGGFHLREWQTCGFGDIVACASEAPMQLCCQRRELAVSSSQFLCHGGQFDEHGV